MRAAPVLSAEDYPWVERAACDGMDPEIFFPPRYSQTAVQTAVQTALMTCMDCPVMVDCRAFFDALETGHRQDHVYGVVGGETPVMRIARRKRESEVKEP